jgi:outer membrane receptor for ferrienterochelin and colicins
VIRVARSFLLLVSCLFGAPPTALAAQPAQLSVEVSTSTGPASDIEVLVNGVPYRTSAKGTLSLTIDAGEVEISVRHDGYAPVVTNLLAAAGQQHSVIVELLATPAVEEEVTVVATTRTDRRLEDLPMRVEVLAREEIEEKMLMTPGDIVMMLNEMGGMRVQATSPSLGAASVRIQGMRGRYTRFLSDGLPLFGDVGGLGLLQIPPMDLGQVEVIKGVASALYGAGAMGGVVNLLSRRPGEEAFGEMLLNRSSRGGTDAVFFGAQPLSERWRLSMLGGGHWQRREDVDDDGWADLPGYSRGVLRPRLFWDGGNGRTMFATVGTTFEDRVGGTMQGRAPAAIGGAYQEALDTFRVDSGVVGQTLLADQYVFSGRAAVSHQRHSHTFGNVLERDRHSTRFAEATLRGTAGRHTWVIGGAIEHDSYSPRDLPQFAYAFTVPGVFVQDDMDLGSILSVSASARVDHHSRYGTFVSPRVSALLRLNQWTARVSAGSGFFGPTFLTEETEAAGLSRLSVPAELVAERGQSGSVDVTRSFGPASVTATFFASRVRHPIEVNRSAGLMLANQRDATTSAGIELLGVIRRAPFAWTGTYTFVNSREGEEGRRRAVALTPRHSAGLVGMLESEEAGRLGLEIYYTGEQRLEWNPFRSTSEPYIIVGLLAERRFGDLRLFINFENLTDVRQSQWEGLVLPQRAPDGRWTVDAWAPLEGRTINGGLRVTF